MKLAIYLVYTHDEWASHSSFRLRGITTNPNKAEKMKKILIKNGVELEENIRIHSYSNNSFEPDGGFMI